MSKFHFIAIGGAIMHNLALELLAQGHTVTGSDDEIFDPALSRLKDVGLLPQEMGWFQEKLNSDIDIVILGMHARPDNPELLKAQEIGLKVMSFPEYIAEHSKDKTRIVIAGSHGKTTSTAMLMHILEQNHIEFDYVVGSQIAGYERMVKLSNAPVIIIEGDEYLSSPIDRRSKFLHYKPNYTMITGIAWDHINVFPTFDSYKNTFHSFIESVSEKCFFFKDDELYDEFYGKHSEVILPYKAQPWNVENDGVNVSFGNFKISLPFFGEHNVQNATGAVSLAVQLGIEERDAWESLSSFPGTARRLELMGEAKNLKIFRDFAHAPSKVRATVNAVAGQFPDSKTIAILELHTFSSLNPEFMAQYAQTMNNADHSMVLFNPHVFEQKKMEIPTRETVESRIGVTAFDNFNGLSNYLDKLMLGSEKKVLLLMSSGPGLKSLENKFTS